jgi:hypothetical protein
MLEILIGKSHYYFLEWYIGYNQIVIALKYQENTIFMILLHIGEWLSVYTMHLLPFKDAW